MRKERRLNKTDNGSAGVARGTYYFFPGEPPVPTDGEGPLLFESDAQPGSSEHLEASSEHLEAKSSEHLGEGDSEHLTRLLEIARPVRESGKAPRTRVEAVLTEVCQSGYFTLRELQVIVGRDADFLRVHYLNRMVKDGRMRLKFPDAPNHPNQAYTSDS